MGEAGIIPPGVKLCLGQRTMLMRPSLAISSSFLLSALLSPVVKDLIDRVAVGSGVKHLRVGDVERLPVPLQPAAEQIRIVAEVDRHLSIVREVESEVDTNLKRAKALRQATLAKAFSIRIWLCNSIEACLLHSTKLKVTRADTVEIYLRVDRTTRWILLCDYAVMSTWHLNHLEAIWTLNIFARLRKYKPSQPTFTRQFTGGSTLAQRRD